MSRTRGVEASRASVIRKWCVMAIAILAGFSLCPAPTPADASSDAIENISRALDALERGLTDDSFLELQDVLRSDPNNALARVALGYTLLLSGRHKEAASQFETVLKIDQTCALAIYGRGLVYLKERSWRQAEACFAQAQSIDPKRNLETCVEYVRILSGGSSARTDEIRFRANGSTNEAEMALEAFRLTNAANYDKAAQIWSQLQLAAIRDGYTERVGCTMTFLPDRPLATMGKVLGCALDRYVVPAEAVETVRGKVTLRANLARARTVKLVTFLVDERLLGVTNTPPFECIWDTTRWSNGPHSVRIVGTDQFGAVVSEKSTLVIVDNPVSVSKGEEVGGDFGALWDRLWGLMELKPSSAAINYSLSLCARHRRDTEAEKAALERVVAADPSYRDASRRLAELYRRQNQAGVIRSLDGVGKSVALTFDDGPKSETGLLLDVLKSKGVKATFFVVGKQCEKYPDLLRRISEEGHALGNHTYSHLALEYLSTQDIEKEIFACQAAVRAITGREMRLIRPPGAHFGRKIASVARKFGMKVVLYSESCSKLEGTTEDKIIKHVIQTVSPGSIILMHNLDRVTLRALPDIIDKLRAQGYNFVTL